MRTWERTWPLPPAPTASASSPCTRTAASHEPQGAPGADRHRRPRDRAVPRTHPAAAAHHRQLGRPDRLPFVAHARGGLGAPAGPRHRLGAGCVRAAREPVGGPRGCAGRRADPAPAVRDRHRDGGGLSAGLRRLEPDPKAGRLRTRHARPWRASDGRDGGWDVGGPVRALGAGDPDRRLASAGRTENPGNGRYKGPGIGRGRGQSEGGATGGQETRGARSACPFPASAEAKARTVGATGRCPGRCVDPPHRSAASRASGRRRRRTRADRADGPEADRDAADVPGRRLDRRSHGGTGGDAVRSGARPGCEGGRIAALADDLALAMRAPSLRIVAPIPGKAAVGIEVPNPMPRMVHVRELIEGADYQRSTRALPIALGKNLEGDPVVADLAKMPHLLIAGVTGSGKSVCINTIITSLIYTHPPEKLKLLMIDPKMVELSMYAALPHLGLPVVTNHHKAASVLKWAVWEMDRRYRLLHANHARNIVDFNKKVEEKKPLKGPRETLATQAGIQKELPLDGEYTGGIFPYIVLIVDELADLMLTVQGEIETPLATLAQKARAIGIHLVLATQRPSVNVITGLIKANFPCRIAFRVSAKVDSRTILDQNGAETMLGNGDMLFLPPGKS